MIVELAAPTTMLPALDPRRHAAWSGYLRRARDQLAALTDDERSCGRRHPATSTDDALERRPRRALDRWVRVRDRHCVGPMCSRAACSDDIDHTQARVDRGLTVARNLGPLCRRCHRLKHEAGWQLDQVEPGRFVWRTRAGAHHAVGHRPVLTDAGTPSPRADGRPRPVLDVGPGMPPPSGWVDLAAPRAFGGAGVPRPPTRPMSADDEPPPF